MRAAPAGFALALVAARAGDYEQGMAACRARDFNRAPQPWVPRVLRGEVRDEMSPARLYERGEGVAHDLGEALRWYRQPGEQGQSQSQYRVARATPAAAAAGSRRTRVLDWLERAAPNGHRRAQRLLAQAYQSGGLGLTPDPARARTGARRPRPRGSAERPA